jgi:hypothetical protein
MPRRDTYNMGELDIVLKAIYAIPYPIKRVLCIHLLLVVCVSLSLPQEGTLNET